LRKYCVKFEGKQLFDRDRCSFTKGTHELALGLELVSLNRLAAIFMLVDRLTEVLQHIAVHLPLALTFLRPVKSELMYVFNSTMLVHAATYDGSGY
jgi:hypothetical protein